MLGKVIVAVDLFAGAGGASSGLARACADAGLTLDLVAINHDPIAVQTHRANHPNARHYCESVDAVNPRQAVPGGRLDLLMAGPECTHHSTARGGKPMNDQSRASAWCILRWATALQIDTILIENVPEFLGWGPLGHNGRPLKSRKGETFEAFLAGLRSLGYRVDWRVLNAADYGDPTTRSRLFIQARRGKRRIAWPEPTHTREPVGDLFGQREPWQAVRGVIDWTLKGKSIFGRKKPLSPNTLRRIEAGLKRFGGAAAEPFLVLLRGTTPGHLDGSARSLDEPLPTLTAKGEHVALAEPFLIPVNYGERTGQAPRCHDIDSPLPTVVGTISHAVIEAFVIGQQSGAVPRSTDEPLPTVAAKGAISLIQPFVMHLTHQGSERVHPLTGPLPTITGAHRGELGVVEPFVMQMSQSGSNGPRMRPIGEPLPTVTTADDLAVVEPFLVNYHGRATPHAIGEPLRTVDATDRYGLVEPVVTVELDILFRMLTPAELARGMSFPDGYEFCGTREQVVKQIGNGWAGKLAHALCRELIVA